jgi:hypothetical protein
MIMNGNSPTLISGVPKPAPSFAMIRSHASAIPSDPARQCPFAAQMVGFPSVPISSNSFTKRSFAICLWTVGVSAAKPLRLPPDENTFSCVDVRTTTRTSSSSRASSKPRVRSVSISQERELRVSESSIAIVATWSATE